MLQLDSQGLRLHYAALSDEYDPLERRLAHEHQLIADLCEAEPDISFKVVGEDPLPPRDYRITFTNLRSIVDVDENMLPVYAQTHVLEIHLPTGFPVEPPICYMVTPAWHPNIQSDPGPYQGRICGNTEGFGAFYSLDTLVRRIQAMLKYEMYHAAMRFPYPEDETVARWVREYGEPIGIVAQGIGIRPEEDLPANWRELIAPESRILIKMS